MLERDSEITIDTQTGLYRLADGSRPSDEAVVRAYSDRHGCTLTAAERIVGSRRLSMSQPAVYKSELK